VNAGALTEKGFELSLFYQLVQDSDKIITLMKPWISYTCNDYKFRNYTKESFDYNSNVPVTTDYRGKKVTGVTPNMLNAGFDLETESGFYLNAVLNYVSKTAINDANTHFQHAYTLLASKIGYRIRMDHLEINAFAGGQNLLDARYSSLVNINADAGGSPAFFNPSPARNFYGGLSLKFYFHDRN
jgi:iron complex outermembrane receptor protein